MPLSAKRFPFSFENSACDQTTQLDGLLGKLNNPIALLLTLMMSSVGPPCVCFSALPALLAMATFNVESNEWERTLNMSLFQT